MNAVRRYLPAFVLTTVLVSAGGAIVGAQAVATTREAVPAADDQRAQKVREDFTKVLQRYPPALGIILKLDPSMMASDAYLAPYPAVAAFLAQHPEVRRSPAYYLEEIRTGAEPNPYSYYTDPRARAWESMANQLFVLAVVLTIVGALGWLVRTAVDYRRWGRTAKVQAEAHTKLLDRFTGNEELLAYVQSPAGKRFLESSPISLDGRPRTMGAPLSRILWSMQAGVVLAVAGIGMNYLSRKIDVDRADPIFALSVILLSLGIGFVVSAGLSYVLSRRLGLFAAETQDSTKE